MSASSSADRRHRHLDRHGAGGLVAMRALPSLVSGDVPRKSA
jgi:hypothetical protein